ncbi:hypothetical protein ACQPZP_29530 [Spirillospora sp. CA-142024]|uniref:hypothetical protein n=1 Tax=Spirillospora sp. CA-142024 TaxID=3240036 RepID=UPI003D8E02BC
MRAGRIEELRRLAEAGDPQGARQLAVLLARAGRIDELRTRAGDGDRFARRQLADWLVGQGRIDEAINELRPLAEAGNEGGTWRLARLLAGRGRVEEAMAELRKARLDDRWRVCAWLASQGRIDLLQQRAASGDAAAWRELRWIIQRLWRAARVGEAVKLVTAFPAGDRDLDQALLNIAKGWREGRFHLREEAIGLLGGIDHPLCRRTRAGLLLLQGRRDEAISELRALASGGDRIAERDLAAVLSAQRPTRELRAIDLTGGGYVCALAFSPDGAMLATCGGNDQTILLWRPVTGEHLHTLPAFGVARAAAFSPDGMLMAGNGGGRVRLWNPETGEHIRDLGAEGSVAGVAFSPDGMSLASAALWALGAGAHIRDLDRGEPQAVAFSPDGRMLATAGRYSADDGARRWNPAVRIWDPATGEHIRALEMSANALAFSPDGTVLATAGNDRVGLWDPATGEHVGDLGNSGADAVAFHPGGRLVATGRSAGWTNAAVRMWNPATGDQIGVLGTCADAVAFSPDGTLLATADRTDGTVRLWPVTV